MKIQKHITAFFEKAVDDPRLGISHVSLYLTILGIWQAQGCQNPIPTFAKSVMKLAKISSSATYVRLLRDLCDGGYVKFEPSFYKRLPSKIYILHLKR